MEERVTNLVVECSQAIDKPAELVWQAVRNLRGVMPQQPSQSPASESPEAHQAQVAPAPQSIAMEQRVVEIDDPLMMMRLEMRAGQKVPWSSYQSRIRIEPVDRLQARAIITCLAAPTAEPRIVEGMLRGLIRHSLQSLKQYMDES
jgi:Polyketide cyclase / dehydrase and lipid transport